MPWVEGESLRDRLEREHQLPLEDSLSIVRHVADALSYAHSRGVIQPRIFFSPDCSVALIAHGNTGGTSAYVVRAINLLNGTDFGQSVEANTITPATLARIVFLNNQIQLEIATDVRTTTFPIP